MSYVFDKSAECEGLKKALDEIFKVLFDEICGSKTRCSGNDSDDCPIHTALNIIEKAKEAENDG